MKNITHKLYLQPHNNLMKTIKTPEEMVCAWLDKRFGGGSKDLDGWTSEDVMDFARDYAKIYHAQFELSNAEIRNRALEIVKYSSELNGVHQFTQEMAVNFITIFAKWYREQMREK